MVRRGSMGYLIVLVGVIVFIVGSFLPYWGITAGPRDPDSLSFFRIVVIPPYDDADRAANVGGFLYLFGGVATLGWIAIAGIRGSRWTRSALAAVTVAWSLTWIGSLLGFGRLAGARRAGWWALLLGVAVVVIGSITTWLSHRRAEVPAQHVDSVTQG